MPQRYYTESGTYIRNPEAYARTGAPMYQSRYDNKDIILFSFVDKTKGSISQSQFGYYFDGLREIIYSEKGTGGLARVQDLI